jgi:Domain of unknown function (DUF1707)
MARRATLRASDADREQVAERLRHAAGEGRIAAEELEERLEAVFAARTYGELDAVVADLPGTTVHRRERARTPSLPHPAAIVAIVFLLPVVVSLLIAAVVVITTLFTAWAAVLAVGWWVFGRGRMHPRSRYRHALHTYGRWPAGRPGGPGPRPWV